MNMNNVSLIGRLGQDAELKIFQKEDGTESNLLIFSIAVNGYNKTNWIPCRKWNGEKIKDFMKKGKLIGITGQIDVDPYTDEAGNNRNFTYVNVRTVEFLEKKNKEDDPMLNGAIPPPSFDYNPEEFGAVSDDDIPF